jgi:hypothetical protein
MSDVVVAKVLRRRCSVAAKLMRHCCSALADENSAVFDRLSAKTSLKLGKIHSYTGFHLSINEYLINEHLTAAKVDTALYTYEVIVFSALVIVVEPNN